MTLVNLYLHPEREAVLHLALRTPLVFIPLPLRLPNNLWLFWRSSSFHLQVKFVRILFVLCSVTYCAFVPWPNAKQLSPKNINIQMAECCHQPVTDYGSSVLPSSCFAHSTLLKVSKNILKPLWIADETI